jgi:thiamine monophosphate synthase
VLAAGAHGVAVRSAILGAQDPARAAQELIRAFPSS